jgi:hypothetical protein
LEWSFIDEVKKMFDNDEEIDYDDSSQIEIDFLINEYYDWIGDANIAEQYDIEELIHENITKFVNN